MARSTIKRRLRRIPHLFAPSGLAALRVLRSGQPLLAFDFDGTLAPIVEQPRHARLSDRTRALLSAVARLYPCAVISGRARRDLLRRLGRLPIVAIAGSHGAEDGDCSPSGRQAGAARRWTALLRRRLRHLPGIELEAKPHGVAVHYRRASDKREARAAIRATVAALDGARHLHGDHVFEVVPAGAPTKGDVLTALRKRLKPVATLYVGDDVTDEDAFASQGPGGFLPVRVGPGANTAARFRLDGHADVERLLEALIRLRLTDEKAAANRRTAVVRRG